MKRKRLCILILVLWGLVHCTLLSVKVEALMTLKVVVVKSTATREFGQDSKLPITVLYEDDQGQCIYDIVSGTGWEYGLQAKKSETGFYIEDDNVFISSPNAKNQYVEFASGPIEDGLMIEPVTPKTIAQDHFLVMDEETGQVQLINTRGKVYFIESQVRHELSIPETDRIYCLRDLQTFIKMMPLVAVLAVFMLISVMLCIYSWCLSKKDGKGRLVAINLGIVAVETVGFWLILLKIDLPSSLLPVKNIFNISHYIQEFSAANRALEMLSDAAALETLSVFRGNMIAAGGILLVGVILCVAVIVVERRMIHKRSASVPEL